MKQLKTLLQNNPNGNDAVRWMANDGYTKQAVEAATKAAGLTVDVEAIYRKVMEERAAMEAMETQDAQLSH